MATDKDEFTPGMKVVVPGGVVGEVISHEAAEGGLLVVVDLGGPIAKVPPALLTRAGAGDAPRA